MLLDLLYMLTGHPGYHVIVECGTQTFTSKTSSGFCTDTFNIS